MASQMSDLDGNHEEGIHSSTPLASPTTAPPTISTLSIHETQRAASPPPQSLLSPTSPSSSDVSNTTTPFLLPIPTPSANKSQASFAYPDSLGSDSESSHFDPLPPQIASADISIAPDGSFVETSSALAARELKRRYDQHIGVGKDVRSPYAITAFVNQHGKQSFRVGKRDLEAVGAEARLSPSNISQDAEHLQAPKSKRRSRMSVHAFISPSLKSATTTQQTLASTNGPSDPTGTGAPRKLRRTRSIPEMFNGSSYSLASSANVFGTFQPGPSSATGGRAHSQSVTSADMPRLPAAMVDVARPPNGDIFGDVMRWNVGTMHSPFPSGSGSARFARNHMWPGEGSSSQQDHSHIPAVILEPFGPSVCFDSPAGKPDADLLPMPHMLREVQSFESGLTARAGDHDSRPRSKPDSPSFTPLEPTAEDLSAETTPHASFIPIINENAVELEPEAEPPDSPAFALLAETSVHSRYSTDVFDILQTYRGLPLLDRMDDNTVIRMSYRPDNTATPRDDPRFVLWGETMARSEPDDSSVSLGSHTEFSSTHSSHASRRKTGKTASASVDLPKVRVPREESTHRVIIAATIERWIAQLTSDLNYDELLNFFLTYRTYISALDLCHLLICRFHWALGKHSSSQDEMARRIVRVRTFVAIRYWLLTFFNVDFLPNRELRLSLANWLNALIRDPILKKHSDGLSIVRKLVKVVKDCKEAHTRKGRSTRQSSSKTSKLRYTVSHVLGDKFAEATYKEEDSDVDLDFLPDQSDTLGGFQSDPANAHLSAVHDGTGLSLPPKPTSVPTVSAAILHQTLPLNILQQSRVLASGARVDLPFLQSPTSLPIHHNTLSRVFVKTIGRLGNWKRVLNSRQAEHSSPGTSTDVSAFDLELNAEGDLIAVSGGVEQYLKIIEQQQHPHPPVHVSAPLSPPTYQQPALTSHFPSNNHHSVALSHPSISEARSSTVVGDDAPPEAPLEVPPEAPLDHIDGGPTEVADTDPAPHLRSVTETSGEVVESQKSALATSPKKSFKKQRARSNSGSSSDSSFGSPIRSRSRPSSNAGQSHAQNHRGFEVVSIDDLDLSDTSSDFHGGVPIAPPGLKKPSRKLPLRRDFEFVRRSRDSVSSMGIISRQSVMSEPSVVSGGEPELVVGGVFQQWQLNAIVDSLSDNEESGDIEATLRRLEGQINHQKQQEKVSKVDGWVKTIQERMAAGDYSDEPPRFLDEEGAEDGEPDIDDDNRWNSYNEGEDITFPTGSISQGPSSRTSQESIVLATASASAVMSASSPNASGPASPQQSSEAKPPLDDAVPLEILQSRVCSKPPDSHDSFLNLPSSPLIQSATLTPGVSKLGNPGLPKAYRSWILSHKAQTLMEHFSMIDRELFMGVKFEELVLDDWTTCDEANILDWAQFLKDRARWKAESRSTHKTSALAAVRARFNLMANFTLSEVVLTHPSERPLVLKKLIRIAWKAYYMSNYHTLVAIMAGLQSEWVTKVMRNAWGRLGGWEKRAFDDLKAWTDAKDDFKFVRQAVTAMVDAKPLNAGSHAASTISTSATDGQSSKSKLTSDGKPPIASACVPFIGVYLSQLYRHSKLPDLIDPTAPNEAVGVHPQTGNFNPPAHPEVFSDLAPFPASMQLEPLINVHKQRLIADVIKMLVAGQHLASRVQHPVDKKIFQKCLKLRGLDSATLQRAQEMYQ